MSQDITIASTTQTPEELAADHPDLELVEAGKETAEPTADQKPDEPEKEHRKGQGGWQRRISKLTAEKYSLRAELEAAHAALEAAKSNSNGNHKGEVPAAGHADESAQQLAEKNADRDARDLSALQKYHERVTEGLEREGLTVEQAQNMAVPVCVYPVLVEAENGPEIAVYLAKHPQECAKLMSMTSPASAVAYVGRIAERLENAGSRQLSVSKAPAPIAPVSRGVKSAKKPEEMDYQEYKRYREAEIGRGGRR